MSEPAATEHAAGRLSTARDRISFYAGLAAIAHLVLALIGYALFSDGIPSVGAPTAEWAQWYEDSHDQIVTGLTIAGLGYMFLLWYIAGVWHMLADIERGRSIAGPIALAGGLVTAIYFVVAQSGLRAAALRAGEVAPDATQAIGDLHIVVTGPTAAGFAVFYAAAAWVGYRYRAFHPVLTGLLALGAVSQLAAYGTASAKTGFFSVEGVFGYVEWLVLAGDVALVICLLRHRRAEPEPVAR